MPVSGAEASLARLKGLLDVLQSGGLAAVSAGAAVERGVLTVLPKALPGLVGEAVLLLSRVGLPAVLGRENEADLAALLDRVAGSGCTCAPSRDVGSSSWSMQLQRGDTDTGLASLGAVQWLQQPGHINDAATLFAMLLPSHADPPGQGQPHVGLAQSTMS